MTYLPPGSPVTFRVEREGNAALSEIGDRGIVSPAEDQVNLIEAFLRADNVGETPGTGLGLPIVKSCVELHHGTICFST